MYTKFWTEDDSEGGFTSPYNFLIQTDWNHYRFQKFSRFFRSSRNSSVVVKVFVIYSLRVNFSYLWELWFKFWKCLQARIGFLFSLSFLWLFNLILKEVSLLPTHGSWQICKWGVNFSSIIDEKFWTFRQFFNLWRRLFSKRVDYKCYLL